VGVLLVMNGHAEWISRGIGGWIRWGLMDLLLVGMLSTVLVETFARGILYRTLADQWGSWPAALSVSLVMAWFCIPSGSPFPFDQGMGSLLGSFLGRPFSGWGMFRVFCSSALFGLILCRFVYHKGDIWSAVGLHAFLWNGLNLIQLQGTDSSGTTDMRQGFYVFAMQTPWFFTGLLIFSGWIEWRHRKRLTSYGRVHF
jgi:membrane protease YdiL (CAAX protease family)